jgi:predicted dehydrogenase
MTTSPTRIAIVGMGGFAAVHHRAILALEAAGDVQLIATCDPRAEALIAAAPQLRIRERGVAVHASLEDLLAAHADQLDLITLPTPVPLHESMHRACVAQGIPVYLEKPPTLDPEELERMIAVDASAKVPTWVGFNFISDPVRQAVKRRILTGEFGALQAVHISASWIRTDAYYARADWAGRLLLNGRLVLDGPLGNAMAHLVHDAMHWAGPEPDAWAQPRRLRASLLRGHRIQGADTALVEVETGGALVRIALTHAGGIEVGPCEELRCADAVIRMQPDVAERCRIVRSGRPDEVIMDQVGDHVIANLRQACQLTRGKLARPATTLADARPFVQLNALAHVSTGRIGQEPSCAGTIPGMLEVCARFLGDGRMPHDQGVAWATSPTWVTPADLPRLRAAVDGLASCAAAGS